MKRILAYLLPSISSVLFVLVFLGAATKGPQMLNIDGDLGRHIVIGGYILDRQTIPLRDVFSHTMTGLALTPHEWLAQVFFGLSYRWMGLNGPVLLTALLIALALAMTYREALRRSESLLAAMLMTLLAVAASSLHWLTRPHIFTFLFLAVWAAGLERIRRGDHKGWYLLPIWMLVWANVHGAFIAGFMVWGLIGAGEVWDRFIDRRAEPGMEARSARIFGMVGGLSALATLINPAGFQLWVTSVGYVGNQYLVGHTAEYLSPDFHSPSTLPFLLLIVLSFALLGLVGKRRSTADVALLTGWAGMGLISTRNIPLFALLSVPILAQAGRELMAQWAEHGRVGSALASLDQRVLATERSLRGMLWPVIVVGAVGLAFLSAAGSPNQFSAAVFPAAAVDWVEKNPQNGQVFNYFPWGGYLLFREWPNMRVFIDGQTDFYGEGLTRQYEQVLMAAPGWQSVLDQYQVGWVLLPPGEALTAELFHQPAWQLVYQDETALIFSRK